MTIINLRLILPVAVASSPCSASQLVRAVLMMGWCLLTLAPCSCTGTAYRVGDSPGWDISTDLDAWATDKTFYVGDILVFQYSSSNSLEQVTKDSFDNCTTTNALETFSNGNTSIPLRRPGPWYFTAGNRLYCLGGMKLQVNAIENSTTGSPVGAPAVAQPGGDDGAFPRPSSRSGNPSGSDPTTSNGFSSICHRHNLQQLVLSALLLWPLICSYLILSQI
ncbi:hypothetical protein SAY87_008247 [Trapa incisa]|uniref:Phytocyanin domain-containing protein n=1 Tax=Trapa incisa TaxID=236973 RepID=A0AAN7KGT7_9MYRT|nr:hypothetical protein SAY87_008247 [Trapa incisa]